MKIVPLVQQLTLRFFAVARKKWPSAFGLNKR